MYEDMSLVKFRKLSKIWFRKNYQKITKNFWEIHLVVLIHKILRALKILLSKVEIYEKCLELNFQNCRKLTEIFIGEGNEKFCF